MSKAFTDEETGIQSVAGRPIARAERGRERPITREGHRAILEEQRRLKEAGPPSELDGQGSRFEHRLQELDAILESVRVVEPPVVEDGTVHFGSRVEVCWDDGRRQAVRLVGPDEADAKRGDVSVESPLARALMGCAQGDRVELVRPAGAQGGAIVSVT